MTHKEKFIHNFHQARTSHIRWVNTIKLLISGINVSAEDIAISPTESEFGKWFYNDAMHFSQGNSRMVLEDIETLLLLLHDKYTKIYPIYFRSKKKSFIGELWGRDNHASEHEIELSHHYYEEIVTLSDKFKHKLRILEAQFLSYGEEKFDLIAEFSHIESAAPIDLKLPEPINNKEDAYFYGTRGRG